MKVSFTKQELADYIKERGYVTDQKSMDDWYDWFVTRDFCYFPGKQKVKLVNWKNYVNIQLRNGKFNTKLIPKPKPLPEPRPGIIPATDEQKAKIRASMKRIGRKPDYGFRSNKIFEQQRQQALRDTKGLKNTGRK